MVFDDLAIAALASDDVAVVALLDRVAAGLVLTMKYLCPVSPVGPFHRSGNLRSSIRALRESNGDIIIGPTADYAIYVDQPTRPHIIESHGPWSLHNRETGQYFGRVVHHPGTRGTYFIERTADSIDGRVYHG